MTARIDYSQASPDGYKAFGGVYATLLKSNLPKAFIDLIYLRVSQINGCAYCIDMHSRDLLSSGVSVEKLVLLQVWHDSGALFTEREKIALAWAETVTLIHESGVPDEQYQTALKEFGGKDLTDLSYAIGLMNAFNRLGITFLVTPAAAKLATA